MEDLQHILGFVQKLINYFENFPFTSQELIYMAAGSLLVAFVSFALLMRWILGISKLHRKINKIEASINQLLEK